MAIFDLGRMDKANGTSPYRGRAKDFTLIKDKVPVKGRRTSGKLTKTARLLALLSFKLSDLAAITTEYGMSEGWLNNMQEDRIDGRFNQVHHLLARAHA